MPEVTIGLDVGTTLTKAVAFDAHGRALTRVARATRLTALPGDRYEQDTTEVVTSAVEVLASVAANVGDVMAIGVTGQGDGLWLVDGTGEQVRPAVSWLDGRASALLDEWERDGRVERIFRRTGSRVFAGASGPLLAWLDRFEPDSLDRAATAAYCKDVVMQRLTGLRVTDPSDASVPFLDPLRRDYDRELIAASGLAHRAHLLAPVQTTPLAGLTAAVAGRCGLPAGVPVVAAPYDLVASALGAGIASVGEGLLILGTTLACQVLADRVETGDEPAGLTLATWAPDRWLRAMPAMVGTAALDWVLSMVGGEVGDLAQLLATSGPGAGGVTALPFLAEAGERAPFHAPSARGKLDGLRLGTSRADLVRAVCEAVAFSARHCLEAAGLDGPLRACGGGVASTAWCQIVADVLDRPLLAMPGEEVGARGAAMAARLATGRQGFPPLATTLVRPDPAVTPGYAEGYQRYLSAVDTARTAWQSGRGR